MFLTCYCFGQIKTGVVIVDFVKVKNGRFTETMFYYENNWKLYREVALQKNYITSYRILKTPADSLAEFDLILITEYEDSTQYNVAEDRFNAIIKDLRPDGPVLLNDLKPGEFRQNLFGRHAVILVDSLKKGK